MSSVSGAKIRRPCAAIAIATCERTCGQRPSSSARDTPTDPSAGRTMRMGDSSSVVLPTPLRPRSPTVVPRSKGSRT